MQDVLTTPRIDSTAIAATLPVVPVGFAQEIAALVRAATQPPPAPVPAPPPTVRRAAYEYD